MALGTLSGHKGGVYYVDFSPRGDLLASAGKDGTVRIWDTTTWQLVRKIGASSTEVNVAAFSLDGKTLATVDDDGKLKLWEITSGHCQLEIVAHTGEAGIVRFSPDGRTIVTGGRADGLIKLWDRAIGKVLNSFRASEPLLENAVFSPDGSLLAAVGKNAITLWRPTDRKTIATIPVGGSNQGVAFSHDGTRLATSNETDQLIRLWEVSTCRLVREFRGHTAGIFSVAFSADDRTIISASSDQTIRLWDVATDKERGVWLGHTGRVWTLAVSPDGRTVASASSDGTVKIWDPESRGAHHKLANPCAAAFGFSSDGRTLVTFDAGPQWAVARSDVRSGALLERTSLNLAGSNTASVFSRDGRLLAIANEETAIAVFELATGQLQRLSDRTMHAVNSLEFSPDNRYILIGSASGKRLWDLPSRRLMSFPWENVYTAAFTQSGDLICSLDHAIIGRWDPGTGRTRTARLKADRAIGSSITSFDGRILATIDSYSQGISLWSTNTLELNNELEGHRVGVQRLAFSPNGKTLASAGADETVKLWDVATGKELLTLDGLGGPIGMLRFSPDGMALAAIASAGPNQAGEIHVWLAADADAVPAEGSQRMLLH